MIRYTASRPNIDPGIPVAVKVQPGPARKYPICHKPNRIDLDAVLSMLEAAANAGEPCPTNEEMMARFGWRSKSPCIKSLNQLLSDGRIRFVKRGRVFRVVEIVATGKRTA